MKYFDTFKSNTLGGSSNQHIFRPEDKNEIFKGRIFFKVFKGGEYDYSILFSNIVDSTYANGSISHRNLVCDEWHIEEAKIGVADTCSMSEMPEISKLYDLTFNNCKEKDVMPGEMFYSDPVKLNAKKNEYVCIEISFRGAMIPYHEETILPVFLYKEGKWVPSKYMPFPNMIGVNRDVKKRITFLGDSITQGLGTKANSYLHWNALVADILGEDYSYWNLGIGYARADDAATDSAWLFKTKQSDVVVVCFGVNDIFQKFTEEQLKNNLKRIVTLLKKENIKVIMQTIPPFGYKGDIWLNVNNYIMNELSEECDYVFDVVEFLGDEEKGMHVPKYGTHPNADGCKVWGERLGAFLADKL